MTVHDTFFTAHQSRTAGRMPAISQITDVNNSKPNAFKGLVLEGATSNAPSLNRLEKSNVTARTAGQSLNMENSSSDADVSLHPQKETSSPHMTSSQSASEEEDSWSFFDFLDVINPLHHIPVVGSLYRHITGDEIKSASRIIGGAVFGGGVGAAVSVANVMVDEVTGKDIGENVVAMFQNNGSSITDPNSATKVATNNHSDSPITWKYDRDIETPSAIQAHMNSPLLDTPTPTTPNRYLATEMKKPTSQQHSVSVDSPPGIGPHLSSQAGNVLITEGETLSNNQGNVFPASQEARAETLEESSQRPELIAQQMMAALDKYGALKQDLSPSHLH